MPIKNLRILPVLLMLMLSSLIVKSQGRTEGLPITVKVITSLNLPNGAVELSGTSSSINKEPGIVYLEIKTPANTIEELSTRADAGNGVYFMKYIPKSTGTYEVTAYASDKKQKAMTSFSVGGLVAISAAVKEFEQAKSKAMTALETNTNAAIASVAVPEDVAKAKEELAKVKVKMDEFDKHWGKLKESVDQLQQLAKKHPEVASISAPSLGKLGSELESSSEVLRQVERDLAKTRSAPDECNRLYGISESCAAFSTTMNAVSGGLVAIGKSIFIDKVWPKIAEKVAPKSFTAGDNFLFTQAGKAGLTATDGLAALKTKSFGAGMAGDLLQFISNEMFKKYCTEYKGPITGTYAVEFRSEGKTYMKYKLTYKGTASVYCRKDKMKGSTPKLSGYLEGNVVNMEFTDDIWVIEKKSEWEELKYERIPAPVIPVNTSEADPGFGAVARAGGPGSFYFPLEAQMIQGKIVIKLLPPHSDLTEAFANRSVVVARAKQEPHNIDGAVFTYPIQNADFFLTRSMRMPDNARTVTLDMVTKNGKTEMKKEFTRTETPGADTKVEFSLQLNLSN